MGILKALGFGKTFTHNNITYTPKDYHNYLKELKETLSSSHSYLIALYDICMESLNIRNLYPNEILNQLDNETIQFLIETEEVIENIIKTDTIRLNEISNQFSFDWNLIRESRLVYGLDDYYKFDDFILEQKLIKEMNYQSNQIDNIKKAFIKLGA